MSHDAESLLRAIWRAQMHVEPRLLEALPPSVARALGHIWEPAEILLTDLRRFPPGLLRLWQASERGHIVFSAEGPFIYRPGPQVWQGRRDGPVYEWEGICLISAAEAKVGRKPEAWMPLLRFFDHLLGSYAQGNGGWFSEGSGVSAPLARAAARFVELEALHYGHEALQAASAGDYFARTLWLRAMDRSHLNVLDPLLCKLYDTTLFDPAFWRRAL